MLLTHISLPYRPISPTCLLLHFHLTYPFPILFQSLSVVITYPKVKMIKNFGTMQQYTMVQYTEINNEISKVQSFLNSKSLSKLPAHHPQILQNTG